MHIGQLIKEEVYRQGLTINQFAELICTSRTNVYHIFGRENMELEQLAQISKKLHRNFFVEIATEMAINLGAETPLATMANYQLASLSNLIGKEIDGCTYSFPEYSKDREGLKVVLKDYFESDLRLPLLILETGYTFGAREAVKQMTAEVFHGCGSAPCPKIIDVNKVKMMPEKVFIDYIDKNTFDSIEESNRRLNDICQVQKDTTKKIVCIIHTDPAVSIPGNEDNVSFDQWGSETKIFFSRNEQCLITVYRWDRQSLLSWAEDNHLHEYVLNYIRNHRLSMNVPIDYQLSRIEVPLDQILLGLRDLNEPIDYPTGHAYSQDEWYFVSAFISEKRDINMEFNLREFILDVINFNENNELREQRENLKVEQTTKQEETHLTRIYCWVDVEGRNYKYQIVSNSIDDVPIDIPSHIAAALPYFYSQALETDLNGLEEEDEEERFFPWLKEHYPKVAQVIEDAMDDYFNDQLLYNDCEGVLRDSFPSVEVDYGSYGVDVSRVYNIKFYDMPEWKKAIEATGKVSY